ncbi:unnamed protein product [Clonostachys chloroleuca]|uniref:Vacuolar protein sorting-associated protein 33A n=1 Tax=Clonostachys chloroleuca TaxID=1926264 RepID=A0AA35LSL5_9HYPO|nr:unnamed protein product [Clonostachys chloroleuca]
MAPRTEFSTEQVRNKARKDLLYMLEGQADVGSLLEQVRGKKNVVFDRSLVGPIGTIVKATTLQEYGVDKFFVLENNNVDTSQRNVVFIVRGESGRHAEAVAAQIKRVQRESQTGHEFHIFWVPRRTLLSDQILEESGVLGDVNVAELPLSFFPLENDVLSLELNDSFRDLYLSKDITPNFLLAKALMEIQQNHGLFPRIIGKGDNAKKVADLLGRMRQELLAGGDSSEANRAGLTPSTTNDSVIIIDREVDFVTPLLTQLTYEGLIDEVFEIQNNQTKVDTAIVGAPAQSQSSAATPQSRKRTIQLDSSDKLYDQLRDANFAIVGSLLNKVARRLQQVQSDYETKHKTKTIAELKEFVGQLPGYQQEHQSARIHTGLAEEIIKHTRSDQFKGLLEVQQNIAAGADPSTQADRIEELVARDTPIREVLRLLCIYSCISGGIKPKEFDHFKRLILQGYGHQHILTLNSLEKLQLFLSRSSPLAGMIPMTGNAGPSGGAKTNYTYLRKQLRLIVDEVQEDDPNDIAYVYSGYAPLSIRLVQCILQKQYLLSVTKGGGSNAANAALSSGAATQGWHGFDDAVKHVRGQTFYELQKGEDKAVKARALLSGSGNRQTVFVVFVGGITFTEIAALRFIAKQEETPDLSRQSSSSNLSSEVAPEIVVWTEDMDLDSTSQDDSDILSDLDMSSDEAPDFYGLSRQTDEESDEDNEASEEGSVAPEDDDEASGLGDALLGEVDVASGSVNAALRETHEASEDEAALGDVDEPSEDDDELLKDVDEAPEEVDGELKDADGMFEDANEVSEVNSTFADADRAPEGANQALQDVEEALEVTNEAKEVLAAPAGGEAVRSVSSPSALTELSELSSLSSNVSSKATTPFDADASRGTSADQPAPMTVPVQQTSFYQNEVERLTFNVRPKASIPRNISSQRYAAECIWAAESSRLNPFALHPEEYLLFRHHISHAQVTTYLNIRNGILRQWMTRPSINVTRQAAIGCANARWFDAASVCYDWLVRRGYINFGCVQFADSKTAANGDQQDVQRKRRTIVVLGAGISGLGCARQLEGLGTQYASQFHDQGEDPPRVIVLEGRSRVGGRVYSRELKTQSSEKNPQFEGKRLSAEMGGMIITGFDRGNPMNILVRAQLGIPYHALTADTTIYDNNGKPVDMVRDLLVEKLYNDCLDRVSEFKHKSQPSKLIEGKRDLIEDGRDAPGDGSKTIMQAEEATAALPHAPPVSLQSVPEQVNMVPVSSDKVTGRVHTQPGVPATLKASEKAKLMGWDVKAGSTDSDNVDLNDAVNLEGATLGSVLDYAVSQYKHLIDLTPQDFRLFNWHVANLEYSNATNLHRLSLPLWDIDAGNEWEGHHTMIVGGYQSVARGLVHCPEPLDVRTNFPVKSIKYRAEASNNGPAIIECEDGTVVEADTVVCTIPLGVLKQNSIAFDPPLPTWKTGVVGRLGFGILNKVVLIYDKIFWEPDRHIFGVLRDPPNRHSTNQKDYGVNRGRFFQWFNVSNTTGVPCLIALMAGDAGFETEHSSNDVLVAEATEILRSVFGSDVPYPVEAMVTRWGSDRFARGSYSSASPEMQPDDYDVMARPIGNLFFAGEHTIGTHPATVHGAYMSGLRAASEVLEAMLGPIEVPTPLVLPKDSLLLQKRQESAKDPRKALLEAYELEVWHHLQSHIGHRPARPSKPPGNAYMLFSRDKFEEARKLCEGNRKPGRTKSAPNEVRVMTSKMWKNASPDERKPYENQAAENKKDYAEALLRHTEESEKWDRQAIALRAAYEKENPKPVDEETITPDEGPGPKHRRVRPVSYAEDRDDDRN